VTAGGPAEKLLNAGWRYMYIRHSAKYGKGIKIIHPGEYYVSVEDELIGTLLGSCVALCLFDRKKSIAGMNHFMLPGRITSQDILTDRTARYGITAINELLNTMYSIGAQKENLDAKIFGGGHVIETEHQISTIPLDNIRVAMIMMEVEDIPITHTDVGSNFTRKVLLDVVTGKAFLKKSTRTDVLREIAKRDNEYVERSFKHGQN